MRRYWFRHEMANETNQNENVNEEKREKYDEKTVFEFLVFWRTCYRYRFGTFRSLAVDDKHKFQLIHFKGKIPKGRKVQ